MNHFLFHVRVHILEALLTSVLQRRSIFYFSQWLRISLPGCTRQERGSWWESFQVCTYSKCRSWTFSVFIPTRLCFWIADWFKDWASFLPPSRNMDVEFNFLYSDMLATIPPSIFHLSNIHWNNFSHCCCLSHSLCYGLLTC